MDHIPRRQPITVGDFGVPRLAPAERTTLREKLRSGGPMDCAIHAAATTKRSVGRVDDRVNAQCRDVGDKDFEPRLAELARSRTQAETGALTTPLSARSCCSSPAWNISRMMSQPPTNSPLTYSCGMVRQLE